MSDSLRHVVLPPVPPAVEASGGHPRLTTEAVALRLKARHASERRFRFACIASVSLALGFLAFLLVNIGIKGSGAFVSSKVDLEVFFDPEVIDPSGSRRQEDLARANYASLYKASLYEMFEDATSRGDKRSLTSIVSSGAAFALQEMVAEDPALIGTSQTVTLSLDDEADLVLKGAISRDVPESDRRVSDKQLGWIDHLQATGAVRKGLNIAFLSNGDSREPEMAGIRGAVLGSFLTLLVTLLLSFPLGVAAAIYLEEFAPKNRWSDFIEVNINNLAAVPSIVFGLLGLSVFLNLLKLPRSAPLVGGLVLSLMTLPTIIIASRAALKAVPPSIREAAYGLGASSMQVILHHTLPIALPGILTGTIIGMARALGETAPLLMVGMVAFIVDVPASITDASTVLPVQVYLWADSPERAFVEKTSGAILVLLGFLVTMNLGAVLLRRKAETKW